MKRIHRLFCFPAIFILVGCTLLATSTQTQMPETQLPVLITSCGQSPGPVMLKVIFQKLKLDFELNPLATASDLKTKKDAGAPYKSLIIVMGASPKGMGAAGISIDDELNRTEALIEEARRQGITIIGAHIEGMKRRAQGAAPGDNSDELSIDAVAPKSDLLIINKEGNADNRFTLIANEKKIPLLEVEKNLDLMTEFENSLKAEKASLIRSKEICFF